MINISYDYNFIILICVFIIYTDLKALYKREINYIYYHVERKNTSFKE